jgi:hypothetical protein
VSGRDSKVKIQKEVPEWQKRHLVRVEKLKTNILNFFPEPSQLLRPNKNYGIGSNSVDAEKLRSLLELKEAVEKKKAELERLRE